MGESIIKEKELDLDNELSIKLMDDSDTYVFKSHNLIESGYNLTLNEQRLTYLACKKLKPKYIKSNIKPSQMKTLLANETFKDIKIYVNEFRDTFGIKSNNLYQVLQGTAKNLFDRKIQYMQEDGNFVEKRWVITSKYNETGKYVELTFHPDLILDLLVIKGRFGRMNYNATKSFKSAYAFRIYELLQNFAYKGTRTFQLEDLRYKLGIYDDKKYSIWGDFKKRVLVPAINSINDCTNLNIDFTEKRQGRKIAIIDFSISQKSLTLKEIDDIEIIDKSQVEEMEKRVGVKLSAGTVAKITNVAIDAIRKYKIDMSFYEYIEFAVARVEEYRNVKTIKNVVGCLIVALSEYWQPQEELAKTNSFNFSEQRNYDWDYMEKVIDGREEYDSNRLYK